MPLTFSIVINTLNRGTLLAKTLESFRWLKYDGEFEVIVVNGPSTDHSQEVIDSWLPHIRAARCDVANLSISRNIGICMARGDVVAFIDDDAIPEPEWLTQLAAAYTDEGVGGAGGLVFDQSGYTYQYEYSTANRLANANWKLTTSAEHLSFPHSFEFPYLQGTNASFRRTALLEVGGFDEELEYYLDETELCCRLVDAGYIIRQLDEAYVHHKFAPSNIRDEHKITRYRYPVIKNKLYFSIKHGRPYMSLPEILADNKAFSDQQAADLEFHIAGGRLPVSERAVFADQNERAWERGLARGLAGTYEYITPEKQAKWDGNFLPFKCLNSHPAPQSIVLVSRDFPPNHGGGIATFNKDLAEALAEQGHIVCVITQSPDINRVDLENGVWVHRMAMRDMPMPPEASALKVPQHVWNWSAIALEEAARIATHRPIDVVEAPIWDCEGIAFLLNGAWPLVTSLQTTLHFWLESHPESRANQAWMKSFGNPMLALEKKVMQESNAVRSISVAIARDIEQAYQFRFAPERVVIAPLGMPDTPPADSTAVPVPDGKPLEVLFVGRLEHRKGIDVLLAAIPAVLARHPEVHFRIIGDDTLPSADGRTYKEHFLNNRASKAVADRIRFEGKVDQATLLEAYRRCDLLVAPSRFESFGLIFVEAMRAGRPVIGCDAGGMPEVVSPENGILVPPGDQQALENALLKLVASPKLRSAMGTAGRRLYLERFTAQHMAHVSADVYAAAKATHECGA
ncbi:glycosyltransferase [Telluria sp. B2]